jgi:D-glycero-D-manno-heptose 1,7-bisphosphate phosphatase
MGEAMPDGAGARALFLDRDGVLNRDLGYVGSIERVVLVDGAIAAVRRANRVGYKVFVVTNQSGVARGFFTEDDLHAVHSWLSDRFARAGARIDAIRYCPHHPQGTVAPYAGACACRKPAAGLFQELLADYAVDPARSLMIGDSDRDLAAARAVGIPAYLFEGGDLDSFLAPLLERSDNTAGRGGS